MSSNGTRAKGWSLWRRGLMAASGTALAVGAIIGLAGPASAHTADASVTQTCVNGTSRSTVHFMNNYPLDATLSYAGPASGTLALPATAGTTVGTNSVTVTVVAPQTLTYTVRWTDGVTQGVRSVPLQPITNCLPAVATTTTTAAVTVVTPAPSPTTPPPAVTTAPDTSTPMPAASVLADRIRPESPATAAILPTTLPHTGSDPTVTVAVAGGLMILGALLAGARRRADRS